MREKKFIISAGHSKTDPGATANGYKEADLAVWLRNRVAELLRKLGHKVIEDEASNNENLSLKEAVRIIKENPDTQAWEIHFNAAGTLSACGVEILAPEELKSISQRLAISISKVLTTPLRGESGYKKPNAGQHQRLAWCDAGGGIIEVEFITNREAITNYNEHKEEVAKAIVNVLGESFV